MKATCSDRSGHFKDFRSSINVKNIVLSRWLKRRARRSNGRTCSKIYHTVHFAPWEKVSGKHDCLANRNSHTEISRNPEQREARTKRMKKEREAATARSFAEVGERRWGKFSFAGCRWGRDGLKSFAIERRQFISSSWVVAQELDQLKNNLLTRRGLPKI